MNVRRQRAQTPWCFKTGLILGLAADYTGQGPTYRRWAIPQDERQWRKHGIGMLVGFLFNVGLIMLTVILAVTNHEWLAIAAILPLPIGMVAANLIAIRLP